MPFVKVGESDIHFTDQGAGQPLVFLHGRSASAACWDWHLERLKDRYRVIAFDAANHGFSTNSPAGQVEPDRVDELDGFLTALGVDRPVLIGQSMGTMTSLRWATRHPRRAYAILGAGMGWPLPPMEGVGPAPLTDGLWLTSGNFNAKWAEAHPDIVARYSRLRSTATAIENSRNPRTPAPNEWLGDGGFGERLATIETPVALFVGADDFAAQPVASLADILTDVRVRVVPDAHHNAYLQCIEEFLETLDELLAAARISPGG